MFAVGGSRSRPAAPAPVAAPPAPPPMTAPSGGGGFVSNMMGNVASGMASGVGFGVAQRAVDAVMGPRSVEVVHSNAPVTAAQAPAMQQPAQQNSCASYQEELNQVCLLDAIDAMFEADACDASCYL